MLNLIILNGPHKGDAIAIAGDRPTILGRQGDVTLKDSRVSRKHAEVRNEGGTWVITDLGSANGTLVNGKRINKLTELEEGDQIQMGRYLVVVGHMDDIEYEHDRPGADNLDNASAAAAAVALGHDLDDDEGDELPDFDELMGDSQEGAAPSASPAAAVTEPIDEGEHPLDDVLDADDSLAASAMAEPDQDGVYDLIMDGPAETSDDAVATDDDDVIEATPAATPAAPIPTPLPVEDIEENGDLDVIEYPADGPPEEPKDDTLDVVEYPADEPHEEPSDAREELAAAISEDLDGDDGFEAVGDAELPGVDTPSQPVAEDPEPLGAVSEETAEPIQDIEPEAEAPDADPTDTADDGLGLSLDDAELPPAVTDLDELELDLGNDSDRADEEPDLPIEALDAALDEAFIEEPEPATESQAQAEAPGGVAAEEKPPVDAVDLLDDEAGYGGETANDTQVGEPLEDEDAPAVVSLVAPLDETGDGGDDHDAAAQIDDASVELTPPVDMGAAGPDPAAREPDGAEPVEPAPLVNTSKGWGKTIGAASALLVLMLGLGVGYYIFYGPGLTVTGRNDTTVVQGNDTTPEPTRPLNTAPPTKGDTPATEQPNPTLAMASPPPPTQVVTQRAEPKPAPAPTMPDTAAHNPPTPEPGEQTLATSSATPDPVAEPKSSTSAFSNSPSLIGEGAIARTEPSGPRVQWLDPEPAPGRDAMDDAAEPPSPFQPVTSPQDVIAATPETTETDSGEAMTVADAPITEPAETDAVAAGNDERIDELTEAIGPPRRVAFLVDASGSLIDTFDQVLEGVSLSVRGLLAEQEYTVIFFRRGQVIETPPAGLKPADPRNKRLTADWLDPSAGNVTAFGRSEIDEAIALALSYGADEITLFSDNALARSTASGAQGLIDQIEELCLAANENPVINTVQFVYEDPDNTLRRIAEAFDGKFVFVKSSYGSPSLLRRDSDELSIVPFP